MMMFCISKKYKVYSLCVFVSICLIQFLYTPLTASLPRPQRPVAINASQKLYSILSGLERAQSFPLQQKENTQRRLFEEVKSELNALDAQPQLLAGDMVKRAVREAYVSLLNNQSSQQQAGPLIKQVSFEGDPLRFIENQLQAYIDLGDKAGNINDIRAERAQLLSEIDSNFIKIRRKYKDNPEYEKLRQQYRDFLLQASKTK